MLTIREFRTELWERLHSACLADDLAKISNDPSWPVIAERYKTLKEVAELLGVPYPERRRCRCCSGILGRGSGSKYCNNSCRQKAYRIRKGQAKR